MDAFVHREVEASDGGGGQPPGSLLAHEGVHGAVVVRIRVAIEEVGSAGVVELGQQRRCPDPR